MTDVAGLSWRPSRRAVKLAVFALLIAAELALVVPHLSFDSASVTSISWPLLAAALGCEAVSIIAYSRMRRRLLRAGGTHIGVRRMGVITLASTAMSTTAPAGTALSTAYAYQQLRRIGANATVVVWSLAAGGVVSGLAFTVLTVSGTVLDGDVDATGVVGAIGLGGVTGALLVAALSAVTRNPEPLLHLAASLGRHLPRRLIGSDGRRLDDLLQQVRVHLQTIRPGVGDWTLALIFAVLNWAADLACFVLCCYAVGARGLALGAAALAYVAGLATIGIAITPGGLGSMEAGMLLGLANGGVAAPVALAGVLAYRVIAYVLVGVVGWTVWLVLRRRWQQVAQPETMVVGPIEDLVGYEPEPVAPTLIAAPSPAAAA